MTQTRPSCGALHAEKSCETANPPDGHDYGAVENVGSFDPHGVKVSLALFEMCTPEHTIEYRAPLPLGGSTLTILGCLVSDQIIRHIVWRLRDVRIQSISLKSPVHSWIPDQLLEFELARILRANCREAIAQLIDAVFA